ncbi:unnamed protein product [Rhizophagus irregularis]|uniref:Uncharacterized protein n=1 Tax=Rhizophagus irregularis TaxID=588596 RepID=A0A2I1HBQ6_9GLOM|nr:hypothetical protein RhiirA4_549179 [Rhizophagus irregularis]CAB4427848.1 unnamed protein product [Rhizophagus irregularis]CAB4428141.1 unnamed protein product [Rhizophagus irregularis]
MSDNQGINNPKNKAYLNRALKKLSRKSEDERVSDIHKRIDKQNKQLAKKEPNTKNRTQAHAMPYTGGNGASNNNR